VTYKFMNHQNLECKWQKCETFLRRKERRQKKLTNEI
jgi:hypothetical protein